MTDDEIIRVPIRDPAGGFGLWTGTRKEFCQLQCCPVCGIRPKQQAGDLLCRVCAEIEETMEKPDPGENWKYLVELMQEGKSPSKLHYSSLRECILWADKYVRSSAWAEP